MLVQMNEIVTLLYYAPTGIFGLVIAWNFVKTRNVQDAVLYCIVLVPFVLRLLRVQADGRGEDEAIALDDQVRFPQPGVHVALADLGVLADVVRGKVVVVDLVKRPGDPLLSRGSPGTRLRRGRCGIRFRARRR